MTDRRLPRGKVGLGDLARVFVSEGPGLQRFVAELLGYSVEPLPVAESPSPPPPPIDAGAVPEIELDETTFIPPSNLPDIPFLYADSFKAEHRDPLRVKPPVERVPITGPNRSPENATVHAAGDRRVHSYRNPGRHAHTLIERRTGRRSDRRTLGSRSIS